MAALAYLFPPLTGLVAFFGASTSRTRFHGLQSVMFGLLWPVSLLLCSEWSAGATQVAFFAGLALWVLMIAATALGREPRFPIMGRVLKRWSADSPREL
jgi:uncharacterized membrane protein